MRNKIKVINVVGARPNFMKIAPIIDQMRRSADCFKHTLLHTGQHYDDAMSERFFSDLNIPKPDIYLGAGSSGSPTDQTADIMTKFEKVCAVQRPDLVLVVGDVNSTLACSVVAAKMLIPVAHVEAGLRSFDKTMPEEVNRIVTDSLSEYLFTTCEDANRNLLREGVSRKKIYFVGNVMIDTLMRFRSIAAKSRILKELPVSPKGYAVLTLHRPSNVDARQDLEKILEAISIISKDMPVIFPVHPRTRKHMMAFGLGKKLSKRLIIAEPLGYLDFIHLVANSFATLTDSGGIQEETTILGIPCLTLRNNTERPVTVREGTNKIVGTSPAKIIKAFRNIKDIKNKRGRPCLWDGKAARRIVKILKERIKR